MTGVGWISELTPTAVVRRTTIGGSDVGRHLYHIYPQIPQISIILKPSKVINYANRLLLTLPY